jgi:hypothetical protein
MLSALTTTPVASNKESDAEEADTPVLLVLPSTLTISSSTVAAPTSAAVGGAAADAAPFMEDAACLTSARSL